MSSPSRALAGVSLLVTDDHADSADLLDMVLTAQGAEVRASYSPAETLALLRDFKPDALLLDISMPEMDGYALLGQIRSLPGLATVPAIAVTGHASERDRARATAAGFTVHTAKPVDGEAIVFLVAELTRAVHALPAGTDLAALQRTLESAGLLGVLRTLNAATPYRFTGLYVYDGPVLRSVALVDRLDPTLVKGGDAPIDTTFCGVVKRDRRSFATDAGAADTRLVGLSLREDVVSYCGALVRNADGTPFGSLCHFDLVKHEVPTGAVELLEAFAPTLARAVAVDVF